MKALEELKLKCIPKEQTKYITIDGDDIGQRITNAYLKNDTLELIRINTLVNNKTASIANFLRSQGFTIIFCAADGVAGYCQDSDTDDQFIFDSIKKLAGNEIEFSAGVGKNLRESYVALLSAKSSGKGCLRNFKSFEQNV